MILLKCCTPYVSKFGNLSTGHRTGEGQFSVQFQRRARRDKKAFQTEQCKEIEENKTKQNKNKQKRKSRDFFKKIKIPREHFMQRWHSKRQKWYGPNRSRKIVRRGGTNTQKNYTKNIFMTQIITMV